MSDLVSFLRNDVVVVHYSSRLLRRMFLKWKFSLSKFHLLPTTSSALATACFTWMRCSFGDSENFMGDTVPAHLFPFYAAVEGDGDESAHFISRLRGYMIDKLEVPAHNLPLLAHAIAMFDARQLSAMFVRWRDHSKECTSLDRHAAGRRGRRALRRWKKHINTVVYLRLRYNVLCRENIHRCARSAFSQWLSLLQAIQYRRTVLQPRSARACLMALLRHKITQQYQRVTLRNGARFDLHKRLLWAYHSWLCRLNTILTPELRRAGPELATWLLQLVRRNWLESQELRDMYISAYEERSVFFRCHRFIAALGTPCTSVASDMKSPERRAHAPSRPASAIPPSSMSPFQTPARSSHVSFNTIPQYEPTYSTGTLHTPALDATLFSPPDSGLSGLPASTYPLSSYGLYGASVPTAVARLARSPSPTLSHAPGVSSSATAVPSCKDTVGRLRVNPSSRLAQGVLRASAARFYDSRRLLLALRRWLYRVPQLKLDSAHTFSLFFGRDHQRRVLQNLVVKCAAMLHRPAYYYLQHKQLVHAVRKWLHRARRWRFLRSRGRHLLLANVALRQTQAFGAWLVTTARYQQLHRTANRIVCNHFRRELWRAWFAWQHYYERTILIRANNREKLRARNEEIERFLSEKGERRSFHTQYSALREWSLAVKDRRRARSILVMWDNTIGKRAILAAWRQWQRQLMYEGAATTIKRIWHGFRVRRLYWEPQCRYLARFRSNIPIYRAFYKRRCQRRIFAILVLHSQRVREYRVMFMRHYHLRHAVRHLWRRALRCRRSHRAILAASRSHALHGLRGIMKRLMRRHRRLRYVGLLDNAHIVRNKLQVLSRWRSALVRHTRGYSAARKVRRHLLRKGWKQLRRNCRVATRIRHWRLHRLRLRARRFLRRWRRKLAHRVEWKIRALDLYQRRRFQTWFRWWWLQTLRHSKRHRKAQGAVDQRKVFLLKMRGGRHFQVVRSVISARVRWYMKKFIDFTSFRRRNRALLYTLDRSARKSKLTEAFQRLMLESHRSSRQRRKLKLALGPEALFARRLHRGMRPDGPASASTGSLLGSMAAPRGSIPPPGSAPLRHTSGALLFPPEIGAPSRPRTVSEVSSGNSLFSRLSRRQMHQNIRHVVSRQVQVGREELQRRLQDNSTRSQEYCMCKRGFRHWLLFTRYNKRNERACRRIDQGFWSVTLDNALKHLYTKLLVHRRMKFRARRVLTALHSAKLRDVIHLLFQNRRRRLRSNRAILAMDGRWSAKFRKRFFTRMYTIGFFRRHVRKVKCVKRLKTEIRATIKRLRFIAWHNLRSPAALAIRKIDLKKKKIAFKRLRKSVIKGKFRRALGRVAVQQHNTTLAVTLLRFWRDFLHRKRALKRIARRFTLVPALKLWTETATTLQRHRSAVAIVQRRLHRHSKRDIVTAWRAFAARSARLRRQSERLQKRTALKCKKRILCKWLRNVDHKINQDKHDSVVQLHEYYLVKRCLFYWQKTALISELCTWRSTRSAVRNWHITARISRKLRTSHHRAEHFCSVYIARIYLRLWQHRVARKLLLQRRHAKALRLQRLRKFVALFRTWKRRMYLVYRERNFLSPLQQNTPMFNVRRSLRIWRRVARARRRNTKRSVLAANFLHWHSFCHKKRFSRIGFLDRLAHFRRRELLSKPFSALVTNCKSLRLQKVLHAYTTMTTKAKLWRFWRRLYDMRLQERQAMRMVFKGLYQHNVHRCFRTWRIHVTVFSSLLRRNAVNHAWRNWKLALAAKRKYTYTLLSKVLTAWRAYYMSIDAAKLLLLRKRRMLWKTVLRRLRDDHLKLAVVMHRLKTGDESVRLCDFRQHAHLLHAAHASALAMRFPLATLYRGMDDSTAGRNLTMSYLDSSHVSVSTFSRGPAPRLLALQRKLKERFAAAEGRTVDETEISQIRMNQTATFGRQRSPTTRFHSPGEKAQRGGTSGAYTTEAKPSHRSPEGGRQQSPEHRNQLLREHVHELFSPRVSSPPGTLAHALTSPTASARLGSTSQRRGALAGLQAPGTVASMAASFVPAARLFSPQGASPFASDITPYQVPRQRGAGTLPTGDLHSVQSRGRARRPREML